MLSRPLLPVRALRPQLQAHSRCYQAHRAYVADWCLRVTSQTHLSSSISAGYLVSKPAQLAHRASPTFSGLSPSPAHLRSSLGGLPVLIVVGIACAITLGFNLYPTGAQLQDSAEDTVALADFMSAEILPGRPGNLTPEQEEKLRRLWQKLFQICGVDAAEPPPQVSRVSTQASMKADGLKREKSKKKRMGLFSRKSKKDGTEPATSNTSNVPPAAVDITPPKPGTEDDKYGQTKDFYDTLANQPPEAIRETLWSMVKHDHPDALLLRFLRARKWDVDKALVMLVSTLNWRAKDVHVDDDIMLNGEGAAVEEEAGSDPAKAKLAKDFLAQVRMGKSFLHGVDKKGRPMCMVRVRLHKQGEQAEESLERYTVYIIETARMLLQPPVDTATIVFDMTGFSLANMDYTPVKFMIKCFEANYPESLGAVLVYKSPWIFQGIWKIIKGWLDPVVAGKVHFTNHLKDMEEYIPASQIMKEMDGHEDWDYHYVEPLPGENDRMKDVETRDKLLAARALLYKEYEDATIRWIQSTDANEGKEIRAERDKIAGRLREDYWNLDPYVRARSLYDRTNILLPGGKLDYYPKKKAEAEPATVNGTPATAAKDVTTAADDVD